MKTRDLDPAVILEQPTLTLRQVSQLLGRSQKVVRKAVRSGQLPSFAIGETVNIPTAAIRKLLQVEGGAQ